MSSKSWHSIAEKVRNMAPQSVASGEAQIPTNDSRDTISKNANISRVVIEKKHCENCCHFNNDFHAKDTRTKHAGICYKWSEVVFLYGTCKSFSNRTEIQPTESEKLKQDLEQQSFKFPD